MTTRMKVMIGVLLAVCIAVTTVASECVSSGQKCDIEKSPCCGGLYCVGAGTTPKTCRFYPNGYKYVGEFTDPQLAWDPSFACPTAAQSQKQMSTYRSALQFLLNRGAGAAYGDVIQFSNHGNKTRVHFTMMLPDSLKVQPMGAKLVEIRLQNGMTQIDSGWTDLVMQPPQQDPVPVNVSEAKGWKDAANALLEAIDTSTDPCDDFYTFACNKWIKTNDPNLTGYSVGEIKTQKIIDLMKSLWSSYPIDGPAKGPRSVQTAARFYRTCTTAQSSEYKGATRLLDMLRMFGNGWPIAMSRDSWKPPSAPYDNVATLVGTLSSLYNVHTLLTPNVELDWKNVTRMRLAIGQATLSHPEGAIMYREPTEAVKNRIDIAKKIEQTAMIMANISGVTLDAASLAKDVTDTVEFEFELAKISLLLDIRANHTLLYNPYTPNEANAKYPMWDWPAYVQALVQNQSVSKESLEMFVIREAPYVAELNSLLSKYNNPDGLRTIYNYILWRFVSAYQMFGGPDFPGSLPFGPNRCPNMIKTLFPWAAGRLYVDNAYPDEYRTRVTIMVQSIVGAIRGRVAGFSWMDDETKLRVLKKIDTMKMNIGYHDWMKNDTVLDAYQAPLDDLANAQPNMSLLDFYLAANRFNWAKKLSTLDTEPDRTDFMESPQHWGAWYRWDLNSITIAAGITTENIFRYDFPMMMNYGGVGPGLAHEVYHAFDNIGMQHDYDGYLRNWATDDAKRGYDEMNNCLINAYDNTCYNLTSEKTTMCVNGKLTQGENLADNGGLKASYYAFKTYNAAHGGPEPRLPSMEAYSEDQIFFMSYANYFCVGQTEAELKVYILSNDHSPFGARVNVGLQNFKPFGEAFGCRPGSPMMPHKQCNIW